MLRMGFAQPWIDLIMHCVNSVFYSVLLNGDMGPSFVLAKGLWQGSPLSSYLFFLCCEDLSSLKRSALWDGLVEGPTISLGVLKYPIYCLQMNASFFGERPKRSVGNETDFVQL